MPPVTLNVGTLKYDDRKAQFVPPPQGVITDCLITNHYERDGMTYAGSLTGSAPFNGSTVGIVRLGGVLETWTCEWSVCKMGGVPPIPDPTPADPDWMLLDAQISLPQVGLGPSGVDSIHRVYGYYIYAHKKPGSTLLADVSFPRPPWVREGGPVRKIPFSVLDKTIAAVKGGGTSQGPQGFVTRG